MNFVCGKSIISHYYKTFNGHNWINTKAFLMSAKKSLTLFLLHNTTFLSIFIILDWMCCSDIIAQHEFLGCGKSITVTTVKLSMTITL